MMTKNPTNAIIFAYGYDNFSIRKVSLSFADSGEDVTI